MKIQLSITMLVSDRQTSAKKCLDSLAPILQAIPSELVVVFTGKDPKVRELISQYTDQIVDFEWCDDFAKARNAGLDQTCGEWVMFIDDDEWFEDPTEIIRFFQTGEYYNYYYAVYGIRNYTDWSGCRYQFGYVGRMSRRLPETRFIGKIHEYLNPRYLPQKYFDAWVHHYGYAQKQAGRKEDVKDEKPDRNIRLLLEEVEKGEGLIRNYTQLVQEYGGLDDAPRAQEYSYKVLDLVPLDKETQESRYVICYLLNWVSVNEGKQKAVEVGEELLEKRCIGEVGKLFLYYNLALHYMDLCNYDKLLEYSRKFRLLNEYMDEHPNLWIEQAVLAVSERTGQEMRYRGYAFGLVAGAELKDFDAVSEFLEHYPWGKAEMTEACYNYLENWERGYPAIRDEILGCYAGLEAEDGYVFLRKAQFYEKQEDLAAAREAFDRSVENFQPRLRMELLQIALQNRFDLSEFISHMDLGLWRSAVSWLIRDMSPDKLVQYEEYGDEALKSCPLYLELYKVLLWDRRLREERLDNEQLVRLLAQYCDTVLEYCGRLYSSQALEEFPISVFPEDYQFAYWMRKGLDGLEKPERLQEGISAMKQAMAVGAGIPAAVNRVLDLLREKLSENPAWKNPEFIMLSRQIQAQASQLISEGRYKEAYAIVSQLCQLMPKNLDALKLKLYLYKMI